MLPGHEFSQGVTVLVISVFVKGHSAQLSNRISCDESMRISCLNYVFVAAKKHHDQGNL